MVAEVAALLAAAATPTYYPNPATPGRLVPTPVASPAPAKLKKPLWTWTIPVLFTVQVNTLSPVVPDFVTRVVHAPAIVGKVVDGVPGNEPGGRDRVAFEKIKRANRIAERVRIVENSGMLR